MGVEAPITMETNILTDLGLDSVDLAELVILVEEEFNLEPAAGAEDIRTVGQLVRFIEK
jgi:acyl carrier protein